MVFIDDLERNEMLQEPRVFAAREVEDIWQSGQGITVANVMVSDTLTVVKLTVRLYSEEFSVFGEARRNSRDNDDPEVGLKLAYGRALDKIAKKMLRQANGKIKHNDDVRQDRKHKQLKSEQLKGGILFTEIVAEEDLLTPLTPRQIAARKALETRRANAKKATAVAKKASKATKKSTKTPGRRKR